MTETPVALADVPHTASCCLPLQALTASDVKHWDRYVVVSEGMALAVLPRHQTPPQQGVEWLPVSVLNPTRPALHVVTTIDSPFDPFDKVGIVQGRQMDLILNSMSLKP